MHVPRFTFHSVTFDCWQTLIHEADTRRGPRARIERFATFIGVDEKRVAEALATAWHAHQRAWHRRQVFAGPEMTRHALEELGVVLDPTREAQLIETLESEILDHEIRAIEGTRELLTSLRAAGVRTALICDTGFTPGRVIRQLLARVGLLDQLEVQIFSNEVGVPKPHPQAFEHALRALAVPAQGAVHVGDLRRSDVAGARAVGMHAVRFRGRNDDSELETGPNAGVIDCTAAGCTPICARPEADAIVDTYRDLATYLTR
jgi:putative hydrolase of the HAD superfamily